MDVCVVVMIVVDDARVMVCVSLVDKDMTAALQTGNNHSFSFIFLLPLFI